MNRTIMAAALACASLGAAHAASTEAVVGAAAAEAVAEGEVVMVNPALDRVTIREEGGRRVTVRVPSEVQSLDEIKTGSRLKVRYVEAVAMAIGEPGAPMSVEEEDLRLAPAESPDGAAAASIQVTGVIQDIDRERGRLTIKGPDGDTVTFKVGHGAPGFDEAKVGDTAVIHHTEAVALEVGR